MADLLFSLPFVFFVKQRFSITQRLPGKIAAIQHRPPTMKTPAPQPSRKAAGGRPPKFAGPSRPVTLTLPEETLDGLLLIDEDRGQAIVKLTQSAIQRNETDASFVEVVDATAGKGVIIVGASKALRQIPFLHLLEVGPGRFMLALDPGHDFKNLEIGVQDMLDVISPDEVREVRLLSALLVEIRKVRKTDRVSMAEILFIRLDDK